MVEIIECNKICLKAASGKMLYNASIDTYTPKAYLFTKSEESDWTEVDASEVPVMEEDEISMKAHAYDIITGVTE